MRRCTSPPILVHGSGAAPHWSGGNDQLTQEDPFYQGEMAADQVIDFRTLKFSLSLVSLEKDDLEILLATE
jgi:hypothetical protein